MTESLTAGLTELGRRFEEHRVKLLRMLENRIDPSLRRRIDPEDVLADAFLKAQSRWTKYLEAPPLSLYLWLRQQTLDSLSAAWRRHGGAGRDLHREMPWPDHSSMALGLGALGTQTSPSAKAARAELAEKVRAAINRLESNDHEILVMRYFDALSNQEAAEALAITTDAAAKRYFRALLRLREELARLGIVPELFQ